MSWTLTYEGFRPAEEGLREALTTLGNGRFATRGAAPEARASDVHYPGTYLAGGYDRLESEVAGERIENEDLVNFPNWLPLTFRPEGGDWLDWEAVEVLDYRQSLHMDTGTLARRARVRDEAGRTTRIDSRRLVHMTRPHLAALSYRITPENWSGLLEIRSGLDGSVENRGVPRYRQLASKHLEVLELGPVAPEGVHLLARTRSSRLEVAQAASTRLYAGGERLAVDPELELADEAVHQRFLVPAEAGETVTAEKIVVLRTSRDRAIAEPGHDAREELARLPGFDRLETSHRHGWQALWNRFDLTLDGSADGGGNEGEAGDHLERTQLILRLHVFHLLQTVSPNTIGLDVGVPARGLHGEAYRGHIFWDEIFILPFYNLTLPEISRSLLLYRFERLDAARANAREAGFRGALYPWQSGSSGREESQRIHLNPRSGRWDPDRSRLQRHIDAAVAYNVWHYYATTGDVQFLRRHGAEMLLEVARFWASIATRDAEDDRWHIRGVMGPDEYQEAYPGATTGGIDDNAYTNVMAVWTIERAMAALDEEVGELRRGELVESLGLTEPELARWRELTRRMAVPFFEADGGPVIAQFAGYDALEELDWEGLRERHGSIARLDRILKAEGDSPDRYKASKQADVLMLFHLLPRQELARIFHQLELPFDDQLIERTIRYYRHRTTHGSTLSQVVFASVLHVLDPEQGWSFFEQALRSDIDDIQGGTTPEGIHLGAMAGTVDIVLRRYAGIAVHRDQVSFDPCLPPRPLGLALRVQHHGSWLSVELTDHSLRLGLEPGAPAPARVSVQGACHRLEPGEHHTFPLDAQCLGTREPREAGTTRSPHHTRILEPEAADRR